MLAEMSSSGIMAEAGALITMASSAAGLRRLQVSTAGEFKYRGVLGRERVLESNTYQLASRIGHHFREEFPTARYVHGSNVEYFMKQSGIWIGDYNDKGIKDVKVMDGRNQDTYLVMMKKRVQNGSYPPFRFRFYDQNMSLARFYDTKYNDAGLMSVQEYPNYPDIFRLCILHSDSGRTGITHARYDRDQAEFLPAPELDGLESQSTESTHDLNSELKAVFD